MINSAEPALRKNNKGILQYIVVRYTAKLSITKFSCRL